MTAFSPKYQVALPSVDSAEQYKQTNTFSQSNDNHVNSRNTIHRLTVVANEVNFEQSKENMEDCRFEHTFLGC